MSRTYYKDELSRLKSEPNYFRSLIIKDHEGNKTKELSLTYECIKEMQDFLKKELYRLKNTYVKYSELDCVGKANAQIDYYLALKKKDFKSDFDSTRLDELLNAENNCRLYSQDGTFIEELDYE